jgi:CheY-like chemotaxis protein
LEAERILIVEDEKIIAFDLQRRLSSFGYNVWISARKVKKPWKPLLPTARTWS